jgi:hypothetical protein
VAINNHEPNLQDTTHIFDGQGQTAMCYSLENRLLHHMAKENGRQFFEMSHIAR